MSSYKLTDKANFPESDREALHLLAQALGLVMAILEPGIEQIEDEDVQSAWKIAEGLLASVEVYSGG